MAITMRAARLNAGYTQGQAAKALGVSTPTMVNWEKGKTSPTVWQWYDLCELYHIDPWQVSIPKKFNAVEQGAEECRG